MRTGIIYYVAGSKTEEGKLEKTLPQIGQLPASMQRVAQSEDEIHYCWWEMVVKGMRRIYCQIATVEGNRLLPQQRSLRLFG